MKITAEQVRDWLGSDVELEDVIVILAQVVNGFYSVEQLKKDIESY